MCDVLLTVGEKLGAWVFTHFYGFLLGNKGKTVKEKIQLRAE